MLIDWVQQKQASAAAAGSDFTTNHRSQAAVIYTKATQFSSTTRQEMRESGLLTAKERNKLHHKWIWMRQCLEPANAQIMKHLADR